MDRSTSLDIEALKVRSSQPQRRTLVPADRVALEGWMKRRPGSVVCNWERRAAFYKHDKRAWPVGLVGGRAADAGWL